MDETLDFFEAMQAVRDGKTVCLVFDPSQKIRLNPDEVISTTYMSSVAHLSTQKFRVLEQKVSFAEAMQALVEGKEVKCVDWTSTIKMHSFGYICHTDTPNIRWMPFKHHILGDWIII